MAGSLFDSASAGAGGSSSKLLSLPELLAAVFKALAAVLGKADQ